MIFLILFLLNAISAAVWRILAHRGQLATYGSRRYGEKHYILLAGFKNQPSNAFKTIPFKNSRVITMSYSAFGFNPKTAGKQLDRLSRVEDTVLAISLGAKSVAYSKKEFSAIAINPCSFPGSLKPEIRDWFKSRALPLEILSFLLGWLSFLPVITADAGKYSLALLADQMFWISYGDPTEHKFSHIILGERDWVLDNESIRNRYPGSHFLSLDTSHASLNDEKDTKAYNEAIQKIL